MVAVKLLLLPTCKGSEGKGWGDEGVRGMGRGVPRQLFSLPRVLRD